MTENNNNNYNLDAFPGSKSHRLAWPMARLKLISKAMKALNNGTDRTGLLYFLLEFHEFEELAFKMHPIDDNADEEEQIIIFSPQKKPVWNSFYDNPDSEEDLGTHDGASYKHFFDIWDRQETALQKFTAKFLDSLDEISQGALGPPDLLMIMPLREMVASLDRRFGNITSGELRKERAKLRTPTTTLAKFDHLLETHASVHLLLEYNDTPTCDNEKIFSLQDALVNFPQLDVPTNIFEREWRIKTEGRTYERYTADLIEYINNNGLADAAPTNAPHAYVANVKRCRDDNEEPNPQPSSSSSSSNTEEILARIEKRLNAVGKGKGKSNTGGDKRSKKEKPPADAPLEYCYQHGLGNHKGTECRNFEADDKFKHATKDNTMGGSTRVWKMKK
jgi:hypothetical protein